MQHRSARALFASLGFASLVACGAAPEGAGSGQAPVEPTAPVLVADKVSVETISLFQAVKGDLVLHGAAVAKPLPVVAGRAGLVRVYVANATSKSVRLAVSAVAVNAAGVEIARGVATHSVGTGAPRDDVPSSFFDVALPETGFVVGGGIRIEVREVTSLGAPTTAEPLVYPAASESPILLPIQRATANLEVRFVPVRYTAEGQNLLPEVSTEGLEAYRQTLLAMYPVSTVHVAMRAAGEVTWDQPIAANGDGWSEALGAVLEARQKDAAADDVYYVGLFRSRTEFGSYCRGGCVLGLAAGIPGPRDAEERAALAVGFDPVNGAETVAHELGDVHGRRHSPCGGAAGPDRSYPNKDGSLDAIGWDSRDGSFYESGYDFMGYCNPSWVSAFTWRALADRVDAISALSVATPSGPTVPAGGNGLVRPGSRVMPYRMIHVDGQGGLRAGAATTRRGMPEGDAVTLRAADGTTLTGAYYGYDEIPGGYLLVPNVRNSRETFVIDQGAGLVRTGATVTF